MKKISILLLVLAFLVPALVMAHPPSKIEMKYDKEKEALILSVKHNVGDVNNHYIKTIEITVNSEDPIVNEYTSQTSKESEDVEIPLKLKTGSEVTVKATCSKYGSKTHSITVE